MFGCIRKGRRFNFSNGRHKGQKGLSSDNARFSSSMHRMMISRPEEGRTIIGLGQASCIDEVTVGMGLDA